MCHGFLTPIHAKVVGTNEFDRHLHCTTFMCRPVHDLHKLMMQPFLLLLKTCFEFSVLLLISMKERRKDLSILAVMFVIINKIPRSLNYGQELRVVSYVGHVAYSTNLCN